MFHVKHDGLLRLVILSETDRCGRAGNEEPARAAPIHWTSPSARPQRPPETGDSDRPPPNAHLGMRSNVITDWRPTRSACCACAEGAKATWRWTSLTYAIDVSRETRR